MALTVNPVTGKLDYFERLTTPVSVTNGGTGLSTIAAGSILAANVLNTLAAVTSTSGLKVLQNNAGTTTWNTTTGTGDSVMATSPTFVTDLTAPLHYGGTGASGTLILQSTSNSTRGTVNSVDRMLLGTDLQAFGNTTGYYLNMGTGNATVGTGALTALNFAPTITVGGNSASTFAALFNAVATVKDDGTGRTVGPALIYASQFTYTATIAGGLALVDYLGLLPASSFYHGPTFNRTGAGTGTMATCIGLHIGAFANIGVGWTITNYDGMLIEMPTVGGTVTTFSGIRSKVTAAAGRFFLNDTGGAQSLLTGPVGFGVAAATDTAAVFVAGTTAKSSLRIPHGAAPTSPVNGDVWSTTAGLFIRVNGATVGPLS